MVVDSKLDWWNEKYKNFPSLPVVNPPTQEEIDEFRRLLEKARDYDKKNNEPDCELVKKKLRLLQLAKELGIEKEVEECLK
jgi:hypothetical protein